MAPTIKYRDHPTVGNTPEQRIAARLRNSGGDQAPTIVKTASGAQRVFHNIRPSGTYKEHRGPGEVGSNRQFKPDGNDR
jgi:hypothetical protein